MAGQFDAVEGTSQGLELVSGKWTILVVFALRAKRSRLGELQRTIEGISPRMLVQTLRKLERHGLVERVVHPVVPPKVEYSLTPLGLSLLEPLCELCHWTDNHWAQMRAAADRFDARSVDASDPVANTTLG